MSTTMDASWRSAWLANANGPQPPLDKTRHPRSRSPAQRGPLARISTAVFVIACGLALAAMPALAAPSAPIVGETVFESAPRQLIYFEDSPVILIHDRAMNVHRSEDEGKTWSAIRGVPENKAARVIMHPFEPKTAFILSRDKVHYRTTDQGATWTRFETELRPIEESNVFSFHATRPNWILIAGEYCDDRGRCHAETFYTRDGFQTPPKKLLAYTHKCEWAISSKNFDEAPTELVHCLEFKMRVDGSTSFDDIHFVKSQDFFETKEVVYHGGGDLAAIIDFETRESFLLAVEKHIRTGDVSLYVSTDAKTWSKANFPQPANLRQDSYTILESTSYSLIVDVKASPEDSFGSLMLSNSDGTYFVRSMQHTNRNRDGYVDFEKVQNIDGVYMVNTVSNYASSPRDDEKRLQTQISFEAGATWQYIMPPDTRPGGRRHTCDPNANGSCSLHLHSFTSARQTPPIFSSKAAPGVVMGVGNVGPYLLPWEDCDTYLSEDGGLTWKPALERPHRYEFGDMGGLIVAVKDDGEAGSYIQYSANRGASWYPYDLGVNIRPVELFSDPESTSQTFLLFAKNGEKYVGYRLDLSHVYGRKCELNENNIDRSDYEKWYARNVRDNPDCLMGVKTAYWRRKATAECMVQESFKDPIKKEEVCPCTDEDFECDFNFVLKDGVCVQDGKEVMREGTCKKAGDTYLVSSGYRKVPGNSCDSERGIKKDEPKSKACTEETIPTDITHTINKFDSPMLGGFHYFLKSSVVLLQTASLQVWRSVDDGSNWSRVLEDAGHIQGVFMHDENEKQVYLFTEKYVYVSRDRGEKFDKYELPAPPNKFGYPLVDFHPDSDKHDWLLYLGQEPSDCFTTLYRSQDAGRNWAKVDTWVDKAVYASHRKLDMPDHGIYSMAWKKPMPANACQNDVESTDANPLQMVYMRDTESQRLVHFDHVVQFYVVESFLAVAVEVNGDFVLHVSVNGYKFNKAQFPPNIRVDRNGFTVLQSTTGSLVVDVAKSTGEGREHGRLFKSNSDGVYFSLQLDNTNRNAQQLVDWEKIGGIEGVILANQVINTASLAKDGMKHIQTMISFNDGGSWNPIPAPSGSDCSGDECHLHLHSVTDYDGPGAVFSAPSSVGLVMGVGNVGRHLLPLERSQTYLSRDAGKTWKKVSDTRMLYEFGDEGGVLVLADPSRPTQVVSFSYDFGTTWQTTDFASTPVVIRTLTTEPTSHTSKITVTGTYATEDRVPIVSTLDFSNRRNCVLDKGNAERSDFEKWSPYGNDDDRCILGRDIVYWRRKPDRQCRVNDNDGVPDMEEANCKCTERDFECDVGFFMADGKCERMGHDPDKPQKCEGTYMARSGFRKIAASVCKDGLDKEKEKVERQCGSKKPVESKVSTFAYRYVHDRDTLFYFPDSDVVMMKVETNVYLSNNDGKDWKEVDLQGLKTGLQRHPYFKSSAVISTGGRTQYLTQDRGLNWDPLQLPLESAATSLQLNTWSFHPTEPEWMIFLGENGCNYRDDNCHAEAFYTTDSGKNWHSLATWVRSCSWSRDTSFKRVNVQGIYCEEYADKSMSQKQQQASNTPVQLVYSDDFMRTRKVLFESVVGYAIYSDYLIAAEYVPSQRALRVAISMDGVTFSPAHYPHNVDVVNPAYTVLDSTTKSVFMAVNVLDRPGSKAGNLFTSNSDGTYFSLSRKFVSENDHGNVDFEKMQGIEGVALLNEVINHNEARQGSKKQLRSMITVDNGNSWATINAPQLDVGNKPYKDCQNKKCSLHLHNYLDRKHVEDLFSSSSIPGMSIGVGNVGEMLGDYAEGSTFLTRDGGHSWKEILSGPHQYDFGDHGSIILLVKDDELPTDHVIYSLDHGQTFLQYAFTNEKVIVKDIVTKANGIGKSFLLLAVPPAGGPTNAKQLIYQIDFSGLDYPTCKLDLNDEDNDDFERWSVADLRGETCMFGRKVEYFRRIENRQCFVGELEVNPRMIEQNCQCTAKDFECDFNYEPDENGKCVLIDGAKSVVPNEKEVCDALPEDEEYYYESIGYRKMALSSCVGDHELRGIKKRCPGRGKRLGFFGIVGILLASGCGAYSILWLLRRYKGYLTGRGSFIQLGNDVYDQIHLPRSSSLPTMNMPSMRVPRSFSRSSLGGFRVPDVVYQAWDKVSGAAASIVPNRLRRAFGGRSGYRYQNLSQEPGEVIMDDYFDHYLDDDDDDNPSGADGLLGHGDGLQDAQERFRDESEDDDGEDDDLDSRV